MASTSWVTTVSPPPRWRAGCRPCATGTRSRSTSTTQDFYLFKKNKTKILVVGGAGLAVVAGVVISLAEGQDVTEEAERFPEPP